MWEILIRGLEGGGGGMALVWGSKVQPQLPLNCFLLANLLSWQRTAEL